MRTLKISFLVFILSINISTQDKNELLFSMYGGLSIPIGSFAVSSMEQSDAGFALLGAGAGLEWNYFASSNVSLLSSLFVSFNGFNDDVLQKQVVVNVEAGSYVTSWITTGFSIGGEITTSTHLYGVLQAGLLMSFVPDVTYTYQGESILQSTTTGFALAGGLGIGAIINSVNIGLKYLTGTPEYEQTIFSSTSSNFGSATVKLQSSILQFVVGVIL